MSIGILRGGLQVLAAFSLVLSSALPAQAAQQLSYTVSTETKYLPGYNELQGHKVGSVEREKQDLTLTVAPTWYSYGNANLYLIYDFAGKRIISVDTQSRSFSASDMHAQVHFRVSESENRKMLSKVLSTAKVVADVPSDFIIESYFSVAPPGSAEQKVERQQKGQTVEYVAQGKTVAALTSSTEPIEADNVRTYLRFMAYNCHLHPNILATISGDKHFYSEVRWEGQGADGVGVNEKVDMKLTKTVAVPGNTMPLPAGFKEDRDAVLQPIYDAAAKLGAPAKFPTKAEVSAFNKAALADGRPLDALMNTYEQTWMGTEDMSDEMALLKDKVTSDKSCQPFLAALMKQEEIGKIEKDLQAVDRSKLQRAEALDVVLANDLTDVGRFEDAQKLMIKAISKNPLLIGAYADLWQILCMQSQQDAAWDCINIARKISPNHPLIQPFKQIDERLEHDFPVFF